VDEVINVNPDLSIKPKTYKKILGYTVFFLVGATVGFSLCLVYFNFIKSTSKHVEEVTTKAETKPVEETKNSLVDKYFKPSAPYTDFDVLYFEPSAKAFRQVLANVSKDKVELVYDYDVNGDNVLDSRIDRVLYTLPEETRDFAMAQTYTDSVHRWYALIAESFTFQKNDVTLVAITDTKVDAFARSPVTALGLPSIDLPGSSKKFTNIYIKGKGQKFFSDYYEYEGEPLDSQGGEHFIPVCYNVDTKELFVQSVIGGKQLIKYLKSYLNKNGEKITSEVPYTGVTCLDQIATVKDIKNGIL
jgi:hypothetical protein